MPALLERRFVLNLPVDLLSVQAAVDRMGAFIRERGALLVVTMNAEMAMQAQADPALGDIIRRAGLVVADGSGVVWAVGRQPGAPRVEKVAGVDLLRAAAARAATEGWSLYLLGAKPGVAEEAAANLQATYPGLRIVGVRDGYFDATTEPAVIQAIRDARPDILLVALGVPRQEKWLAEHQGALGVPVAMGVGGSFDVFAGRVKRAPLFFQKFHIEWLFRLIQEPWRFQRMWATLPAFVKEVRRTGNAAPASEETR